MTRGVDEGDRALVALQLGEDLVGADVLGDAARLALADVGLADRVQQARLAVVDVTHDGDDRGPELEVVVVARVLAVGEVEAVEQLAVLLLRADDLDDVVHLAAEQLEDLVGDRLGGGDHLTEVEQHLHQRRRVGADLVGEVGQRRATGELDRLARALRQADAADRGGLHGVVLLALLPLRLATLAGRPAGTAERTRGTAAAAAACAATTGTTAATGTAAETAAARGHRRRHHRDHRHRDGSRRHRDDHPDRRGRPPGPPGRRHRDRHDHPRHRDRGRPRRRTGGHHARVRARRHVAGRRRARTALTGPRTTGPRTTRTGVAAALGRGGLATLRGHRPAGADRAGARPGAAGRRSRRRRGCCRPAACAGPAWGPAGAAGRWPCRRRRRAGPGRSADARADPDGRRPGPCADCPGRDCGRALRAPVALVVLAQRTGICAGRSATGAWAAAGTSATAGACGAGGCLRRRLLRPGGGAGPGARTRAGRTGRGRPGPLGPGRRPGRERAAAPPRAPAGRGGGALARRGLAAGTGTAAAGTARGTVVGVHRPWTPAACARRGPRRWRRGTSRTPRGPATC